MGTKTGHCMMPREIYLGSMWKREQGFVDDEVYDILVSPPIYKKNAVQIHLGAMLDGKIQTFGDLNSKLRKDAVKRYLSELEQRIFTVIRKHYEWDEETEEDLILSYGHVTEWDKESSLTDIPIRIVLMAKNAMFTSSDEEILRKQLKGELINWMEEVLHDVPVDRREEYVKDYHAILDASLLPHKKEENNFLTTLTIISIVLLFISLFLMDWFIFQVMAAVIAGYTGYRAAQQKQYVCFGICATVCIVGLLLCGISYKALQKSMDGIQLPTKK